MRCSLYQWKANPLGSFFVPFMMGIDLADGGGYLAEIIGELLLMAINATLGLCFQFHSLWKDQKGGFPLF